MGAMGCPWHTQAVLVLQARVIGSWQNFSTLHHTGACHRGCAATYEILLSLAQSQPGSGHSVFAVVAKIPCDSNLVF